jgi:hypothetical protein
MYNHTFLRLGLLAVYLRYFTERVVMGFIFKLFYRRGCEGLYLEPIQLHNVIHYETLNITSVVFKVRSI